MRPEQLSLRDTAFVVCTPQAASGLAASGGGFHGFGSNELGLRFGTAEAAASLLAACEAVVGGDEGGLEAEILPRASHAGTPYSSNYASQPASALATPRATPTRAAASEGVAASQQSRLPLHRARAASAARSVPAESAADSRAQQDVLRLNALLAERDMEAGRLIRRLEQAQAQVRARDAKIADLTRRLAKAGGGKY